MPCCTASVCRQVTANSSHCLWVTDDILAEAWNRYARVSNAASKRGCAGRRYGSNVPGPLEALRRSSKRRMAVAAVAGAGPPSGPDFGALFGLGGLGYERRRDAWKWEPPQLDRRKTSGDEETYGWFKGTKSRRRPTWDSFLEPPAKNPGPESGKALRTVATPCIDPIEDSRRAFSALLQRKKSLRCAQASDLTELIDFLQSSADEPAAGNLAAMIEWLLQAGSHESALSALADLVTEKLKLDTMSTHDLASALYLLVDASKEKQASSILNTTPLHMLADVCTLTSHRIFGKGGSNALQLERGIASLAAESWLWCLRNCEHLQVQFHFKSEIWQTVYGILAGHCRNPSTFAKHFSTLSRVDLARVLLRHWALEMDPSSRGHADDNNFPIRGSFKHVGFPQTTKSLDLSKLIADLDEPQFRRHTHRRPGRHRGYSQLVDMLAMLQQHQILTQPMMDEILSLLRQTASPGTIHRICWEIRCHPLLGLSTTTALRVVDFFIENGNYRYASNIFAAIPSIPLSHCYTLPIKLAMTGECPSVRIWTMLQRQTQDEVVNVEHRDPSRSGLTLKQEHVDVVHMVAHAFANCSRLTPRQAFRRVWQCYLFLQDRQAPLSPILSRAFVTAGVIRQLQQPQRISKDAFRYILSIVSKIEGNEMAEKLDQITQKIWQNKTLPSILERQRQVGSALIPGIRQVQKETHFRLKLWHRRHRVWLSADYNSSRDVRRHDEECTSRPPVERAAAEDLITHEHDADTPVIPTATTVQSSNNAAEPVSMPKFTPYVPMTTVESGDTVATETDLAGADIASESGSLSTVTPFKPMAAAEFRGTLAMTAGLEDGGIVSESEFEAASAATSSTFLSADEAHVPIDTKAEMAAAEIASESGSASTTTPSTSISDVELQDSVATTAKLTGPDIASEAVSVSTATLYMPVGSAKPHEPGETEVEESLAPDPDVLDPALSTETEAADTGVSTRDPPKPESDCLKWQYDETIDAYRLYVLWKPEKWLDYETSRIRIWRSKRSLERSLRPPDLRPGLARLDKKVRIAEQELHSLMRQYPHAGVDMKQGLWVGL